MTKKARNRKQKRGNKKEKTKHRKRKRGTKNEELRSEDWNGKRRTGNDESGIKIRIMKGEQ